MTRRPQLPMRRPRPSRPHRPGRCKPCEGVGTVAVTDLNGLGDLGVATTASARAKAVELSKKRKLPPILAPKPDRPLPRPRLPRKAQAIMAANEKQLEKAAVRRAASLGRSRRRTDAELDTLDKKIEQRKIPAGKMKAAIVRRRQLAGRALAEDLRATRAKVAARFAKAARKTKNPTEKEALRRASASAMITPLEVNKGQVIPRCPPGFQRIGSGALDGYPGSAYTGGQVPQYAKLPGAWRSPAFHMRQALLAAGSGNMLANRPPAFQVPTLVNMPPSMVNAGKNIGPTMGIRPDQLPPGVILPGMPGIPSMAVDPNISPATEQNPAYRPQIMPPDGTSNHVEDITVTAADQGGLGADMVLADALGAYDTVIGAADADMVLARYGLAGLDDLGDLGAIGDKVRASLKSWRNRYKLHRHNIGRKATAALIASSIAGGGTPLLGVLAGRVISQTAKAQADEEAATVRKLGGKVSGAKAKRHVRLLNKKFQAMGLKVRCVPMK